MSQATETFYIEADTKTNSVIIKGTLYNLMVLAEALIYASENGSMKLNDEGSLSINITKLDEK